MIPAMSDYRSGIRRIQSVYPPDKLQERGRMLRDSVVRPGCELELFNLPPVRVAHLQNLVLFIGKSDKNQI